MLACDLVGTHLAAAFGLPTFDYALVQISEMDELPFHAGGQAQPGPAFVTRAEPGAPWGGDSRALNRVSNQADISRLVCMDTWLRNPDRHGPNGNRVNLDNVFFSMETGNEQVELRAMDFTHAFVNGRDLTKRVQEIANVKDEGIYGLFPAFRKRLDRSVVRDFCERLAVFGESADAVGLIPDEWEVEGDAKNALKGFIEQRAGYLADTLEHRLFDPPQLEMADLLGGET